MARRVFFSFHFDDSFRANQVRMANVVLGPDIAGFFDHSEYEEAKKTSDAGVRRMILRHLERTTVTVVLISQYTWIRPWIRYEIEESIKRDNGLLGIYVHHLQDPRERRPRSILAGLVTPPAPPVPVKPLVPAHVEFPAYMWDAQNVAFFARQIEEAGQRSDRMRRSRSLPPFLPIPKPRPSWIP